jgi:hypothetical protein
LSADLGGRKVTSAEYSGNKAAGNLWNSLVFHEDLQGLARDGQSIYDEVTITGEETRPVEVIVSGK